MIAVDTNVLVYAHRADTPFSQIARRRLTELAEGSAPWAIPWPCLHEFLAIVTRPGLFVPPTPFDRALEQVEAWLESPTLHLLGEGPGYFSTFAELASAARVSGGLVHDARIAALCLFHGVRELWTADRDFNRFPSLAVHNPLIPATAHESAPSYQRRSTRRSPRRPKR